MSEAFSNAGSLHQSIPKHLIISQVVQARLQTNDSLNFSFEEFTSGSEGDRVYTFKPRLTSTIHGGKQFIHIADLVFPHNYAFDRMTLDLSINTAVIHQMILRYICAYFSTLYSDPAIGILSYDQLKLLFKNKYLNAPNEEMIIEALETWMTANEIFRFNALGYEKDKTSSDGGIAYKELQELMDNVNWPILSVESLIRLLSKPHGAMKRFDII